MVGGGRLQVAGTGVTRFRVSGLGFSVLGGKVFAQAIGIDATDLLSDQSIGTRPHQPGDSMCIDMCIDVCRHVVGICVMRCWKALGKPVFCRTHVYIHARGHAFLLVPIDVQVLGPPALVAQGALGLPALLWLAMASAPAQIARGARLHC